MFAILLDIMMIMKINGVGSRYLPIAVPQPLILFQSYFPLSMIKQTQILFDMLQQGIKHAAAHPQVAFYNTT